MRARTPRRRMFPFGPEALALAQAEVSAFDFSELARESAERLRLRAIADRMRDHLLADQERPAIDVTSGSSPTGTTGAAPEAASRGCGSC